MEFLASAILGALSALALPPMTLFPVLFLAVPGLLSLVERSGSRHRALRLGYVFGFAHHMVGLYWITDAILVRASDFWWLVPFAVPMLAGVLAFFIAVPCWAFYGKRPKIIRVIRFAGVWVLADLARQFIGTGFPWNLWGSDLELPGLAGTTLIQSASLIGVHGLTLLVLLMAGFAWLGRRGIAASAGILIVIVTFGAWRLSVSHAKPLGITAVIVQGDVPETVKWTRDAAVRIFDRYLDLSRRALSARNLTKPVLIWPETASPFLLAQDASARQAIANVTGAAVPAIIGTVRFAGQTPFNSLVVLDPPPKVAAIYDKWHLVPFGEYQPSWLPGLNLGLGNFGSGPGPRTLKVPGLPAIGPLICYEAVFSGQVIDEHNRPRWLVNITNDAWFGNSWGPRQHLAAARLRAVEEGLPIVRAANTGISAGFDAWGRMIGHLGLNKTGTFSIPVPGSLPRTLYSHGGLLIPFALAVGCLILSLLPIA